MADEGNNLGLSVVVQTLGGGQMDTKLIRFASGRHHHQSKQPMLVLFTDDGRRSATVENAGEVFISSLYTSWHFKLWILAPLVCMTRLRSLH